MPLLQLAENRTNPRTITPENLQLLVNSILELPKMLEIRPVVIQQDGTILGGNMRYRALSAIAELSEENLMARLGDLRSAQSKNADEIGKLSDFWRKWKLEPFAYVVDASTLTEEDRQAFIVKDNVNFGQWDWDALENFSQDDLRDWGVQTWASLQPLTLSSGAPEQPSKTTTDTRERIIIIFPRERKAEVERLLALPSPSKPVYKISELLNQSGDESSV